MASTLFISLLLLSLVSLSSPLPSETVVDAAEILSNNGFVAMALTLELIADSMLSQSNLLTIFSPTDASFVQSGQPSLSLLRFHFLPLYLSPESLKSLEFGTKISTMSAGESLTVTSSRFHSEISLNGVKIVNLPLYDDGSLVVFGIEKFLDPKFEVTPVAQSPSKEFRCGRFTDRNPFGEAIETLRSNRYYSMALFLESQILGFRNRPSTMTVFAPSDDSFAIRVDNFTDYPILFFRQILPCRILWNDLVDLEEGTKLSTYSEGFAINVTKSSGVLLINGVAVIYPNMYLNEWLVVHGLHDVNSSYPERSEHRNRSSEMRNTNNTHGD